MDDRAERRVGELAPQADAQAMKHLAICLFFIKRHLRPESAEKKDDSVSEGFRLCFCN